MAALVAVPLLVAACTASDPEPSPSPVLSESHEAVASQQPSGSAEAASVEAIAWYSCGLYDCGTLTVPLDWASPDGETIEIALKRLPAGDQEARIGSLLINPGGPGVSGLEFLGYFTRAMSSEVLAAYDIVAFDPRGVGESTAVDCGDAATLDAVFAADIPAATQEDLDAASALMSTFAEGCEEGTGALIENVDTVSAARDMEALREALGDQQLNYVGYSYGTRLGATYAVLYPERVGRVVLDGAYDFLASMEEQVESQVAGFDQVFLAFLDYCERTGDCPLSTEPDLAREQIAYILEWATETGFPTSIDGVRVNGTLAEAGVIWDLYDDSGWPTLLDSLREIVDHGTATTLYQEGNGYLSRDPYSGLYASNQSVANLAIMCLDSATGEEWTLADQRALEAELVELSPAFGLASATGASCDSWPWLAHEAVDAIDYPDDANPILVVGTTGDPATPYEGSKWLTAELGNAVLLTFIGDQHTAYGWSTHCLDAAVDAFLLDGKLPAEGTECEYPD